MIRFFLILPLLLIHSVLLFPRDSNSKDDLLNRANKNYSQVFTSPEEAFQEASIILKEAQKVNNHEAELCAISTQCVYYESKNDFEKLMNTAKLLFQKAESYQSPVYQTYAKIDLFNAYAFNGLYNQAFEELEQGEKIINRETKNDLITTLTRINLNVAFSNYYLLQKDYVNQLRRLKMSAIEYEKLTDTKHKERLRYIDYSNRSKVFIDLGKIDSADYYARLSLSKEKNFGRDDIQFSNFLVLGRVSKERSQYDSAIFYFKEAEKIKGYKNHLNLLTLYENIIQSYQMLNEAEEMKEYEDKMDSLKLRVSENQNKSLHTLLNEKGDYTNNKLYIAIVLLFLMLSVFIYLFVRKNKILTYQEKNSDEYLKENPGMKSGENYSELIVMLRNNDPAFITYFNDVFPNFSPRLLEINPDLNQSDLDFCALLKLKLPTSDIARYKFITIKSVQNRKYNIRKKLNIPTSVDIYNWFSSV